MDIRVVLLVAWTQAWISMLAWALRLIQSTDIHSGSLGGWLLAWISVVARILRSSIDMDIHGKISPTLRKKQQQKTKKSSIPDLLQNSVFIYSRQGFRIVPASLKKNELYRGNEDNDSLRVNRRYLVSSFQLLRGLLQPSSSNVLEIRMRRS